MIPFSGIHKSKGNVFHLHFHIRSYPNSPGISWDSCTHTSCPPPYTGCRCSAHIKACLSYHCSCHFTGLTLVKYRAQFLSFNTHALILSFPRRTARSAYARLFNTSVREHDSSPNGFAKVLHKEHLKIHPSVLPGKT